MPKFIVKQPDGLYSIFSTVVDHFVFIDADIEELKNYFNCNERVERELKSPVMSYEEATDIIDFYHGTRKT